MSKERLEEIKKVQYQIIEVSKTNMLEDFNYLLSYIDNLEMAFDDLDSDYIDLVKQNKLYREALEFYANDITWKVDETQYSDADKYKGEIARNALEQSE